jgi:hypothetical protein
MKLFNLATILSLISAATCADRTPERTNQDRSKNLRAPRKASRPIENTVAGNENKVARRLDFEHGDFHSNN